MRLFLALAHHRLGHEREARTWEGVVASEEQLCQPGIGGAALVGLAAPGLLPVLTELSVFPGPERWHPDWEQRLIRQQLRREAAALFKAAQAPQR